MNRVHQKKAHLQKVPIWPKRGKGKIVTSNFRNSFLKNERVISNTLEKKRVGEGEKTN
jgi:hypothetical protein